MPALPMPARGGDAAGDDAGARPAGPLSDRAVDLALRGLIGALLRLPYEARVPAMGAVMRRAVGPLAGYRRRALQNLELVRPDWPEARRRAVADAALDNFGRTLIENYSHRELGARLAAAPVSGGGLAHVEQAAAEGRPVLFVTGHLGNHEAPRHALAARGFAVGGLYREMGNAFVNAHYARTMTAFGGPVFPRGRRGTLGFVRHLRGGGMATLLFDVHDRGGVPIPFLGRPALTATTAADLAGRLGALLVPYWGVRRPDGLSFDVVIEEPVPAAEPIRTMQALTERLEAQVLAHPGQWFWVHRRWKGAKAPPPPPRSGPAPAPGG